MILLSIEQFDNLRINSERFRHDFDQLSEIGARKDQGVNRTAFSDAHLAARHWFANRITAAGLDFHVDGAGNHSGVYKSNIQEAHTLLLGSHLDTVPSGGKYDGALGVLAALAVLRCVKEAEIRLPFNLEAIDFTDEEGTMISVLGSLALSGLLSKEDLENPSGDIRSGKGK